MRSPSVALVFVLLCACTRESQLYHPTMESDPPELGAEAIAYQNRLADAYQFKDSALCRYIQPGYQTRHSYTYDRYHPPSDATTVFRCYELKDKPNAEEVRAFAQAGFALSDLYCRTFFRRLALHSNERRYSHSVVNGVGTLASAIMGLASVGSAATGAVGTAFGTADAAFTNYDATFLVEPDPSLLQQDVMKRQGDVESDFDTAWTDKKKPALTYYDANKYIERHAAFCTFYGMKAIINANLKSDSKTDNANKTDEKPKIDVAGIITSVSKYAAARTDKNGQAAANKKLWELSAALQGYVSSGKNDTKANNAIDALSSALALYQKDKSEAEAKVVDQQIDKTVAALNAVK